MHVLHCGLRSRPTAVWDLQWRDTNLKDTVDPRFRGKTRESYLMRRVSNLDLPPRIHIPSDCGQPPTPWWSRHLPTCRLEMKGKGAFENSICMLDDSSTSDQNSGSKSLICNLKQSGRMESIPFEVNNEFIISFQIRLINPLCWIKTCDSPPCCSSLIESKCNFLLSDTKLI